MPLIENRDTINASQVSLVDIVDMCLRCKALCDERTMRFVENRSRAPRGWESEYMRRAEQNKKQAFNMCVESCEQVSRSCPNSEEIHQYLEYHKQGAAKNGDSKSRMDFDALPSAAEIMRCESVAERFARTLFAVAHLPTKVSFDAVNPKTGERLSEGAEKPEAQPELSAKSANDEIMRRWSTSRKERINLEEHGVIRTEKEIQAQKEEYQKLEKEENGTRPRW